MNKPYFIILEFKIKYTFFNPPIDATNDCTKIFLIYFHSFQSILKWL